MDKTEKLIIDVINYNRDKIIALAKSIKGEQGFYEFDTAEKMKNAFASLGLSVKGGLARTGLKAVKQYSQGKALALIGELDGVSCPSHPFANPQNGIAHACGHNAQLAAVYGAAIALCNEDIVSELSGSAVFFAVPSEEYVPVSQDVVDCKITETAGKPELIKRGEFDNIDAALITHVHMLPSDKALRIGFNPTCGFVAKDVTIKGKAAHAAAAPFNGINALNAASLALNAIGLIRETFKEEDCVRIHCNIINGGTALNVVPDTVVVKAMVRGKTKQAVQSAAQKFDDVFIHCAQALGAKAEINTINGYIPTPFLPAQKVTISAAQLLNVDSETADETQNFASTDVGFLTEKMPVLGFTHGGVKGALHSADFTVTDEETAYILPAKMMALQAYYLLKNGGEALNNLN